MKKLVSALLAAAALLTTSISAQAATATTDVSDDMVNINGYQCYEMDGQYYTIIDDEEYLVIDTNKLFAETIGEQISAQNDENPIGMPPNWTNYVRVTLEDGVKYVDTCDISNGIRYCSPVFEITPKANCDYRMKITTGQWLSNKYTFNVYFHAMNYVGDWTCTDTITHTFSLFNSQCLIFTGTASNVYDAFAMSFDPPKDNNSPETVFLYDVTAL